MTSVAAAALHAAAAFACTAPLAPAVRTELYFGRGRVARSSWQRFVADVVTPRFPEGLTILDAQGQWRGKAGRVRERSGVIVIIHRADVVSDARIEVIRAVYRRRFGQESVLRADSEACIAF